MIGVVVAYVLTGAFIFGWPTWQVVRRDIACGTTPWIAITSGVGTVLLWPMVAWTAWRGR